MPKLREPTLATGNCLSQKGEQPRRTALEEVEISHTILPIFGQFLRNKTDLPIVVRCRIIIVKKIAGETDKDNRYIDSHTHDFSRYLRVLRANLWFARGGQKSSLVGGFFFYSLLRAYTPNHLQIFLLLLDMSEAPQPSDADDVASPPIATHPPALSAELDHVDDENDDDQLVASTATVEAGLPLKRPRGRPKGSKNKTAIQANEKAAEVQDLEDSKKRPIRQSSAIARPASSTEADAETSERAAKRPRGRPRKDGLPAGSVVPLKRPRQSTSAANITSTTSKNNQNVGFCNSRIMS